MLKCLLNINSQPIGGGHEVEEWLVPQLSMETMVTMTWQYEVLVFNAQGYTDASTLDFLGSLEEKQIYSHHRRTAACDLLMKKPSYFWWLVRQI